MILEFSVENYRSIKNKQIFTLVAHSSKIKGENVFEIALPGGNSVRLLKTAMIYGANAAGKSNLIKALGALIEMIKRRSLGVGKPIAQYDPFLFSRGTTTKSTSFEIAFIFKNIKYIYRFSYTISYIEQEELIYFPKGQPQQIFERSGKANDLLHKIKLGKNFGNREIDAFNNQLALSKFGTDTPHADLTELYTYFSNIDINNAVRVNNSTSPQIRRFTQRIHEKESLRKNVAKLLQIADTKIEDIEVSQSEENLFTRRVLNEKGELVEEPLKRINYKVSGIHTVYDESGNASSQQAIDFDEESEGTRALFWRGGLILEKLEKGGVLVFDELDNSLHPKLVKFLIKLFAHPRANPQNAQLIFATHEVTLLDRDLLRTDQIWFAEKNEMGETEIFSVQDFDGVREDIPFDKWYLAGKFGGLPKIDEIESIFSHE